jgi:pectate lyase
VTTAIDKEDSMHRPILSGFRAAWLPAVICILALAGCIESVGRLGNGGENPDAVTEDGAAIDNDAGIPGGDFTGTTGDSGNGNPSQDPGVDASPPAAGCGDGLCGQGEDCQSCQADCGECCTGGLCVFPGATGFGVTTPAGRGGQVIRVTNLDASGSGSLKAAVDTSGPRTIIFDVSGTIELSSAISISKSFVTIAGQTAPSPGITLRGAGIKVSASDVLIQHIRVRVGDDPSGPNPDTRDGIMISASAKDVVVDHVSISWAIDENTSTYGTNMTFSNCIISEALYHSLHPKGGHRNLFAHNVDRNPQMNSDTQTVIVNNLVYDPVDDAFGDEWGNPTDVVVTIIGNVQIDGPDTSSSTYFDFSRLGGASEAYQEDNIGDQKPVTSGSCVVNSPPLLHEPASLMPSSTVKAHVLKNAGARPADRDDVDKRIINEANSKSGHIIDSPDEVGGYPSLQQNTRELTLPPDHNGDDDGDGYTNLEEWLHELAHDVGG